MKFVRGTTYYKTSDCNRPYLVIEEMAYRGYSHPRCDWKLRILLGVRGGELVKCQTEIYFI